MVTRDGDGKGVVVLSPHSRLPQTQAASVAGRAVQVLSVPLVSRRKSEGKVRDMEPK